jgi:hypothetical protein
MDRYTRYLNADYANITTNTLTIEQNLLISAISTVTPLEGGTIYIPKDTMIVYINLTISIIQITIVLPLLPKIGQFVTIVSNHNISTLHLNGNGQTFGMVIPSSLLMSTPLRLCFSGVWIII